MGRNILLPVCLMLVTACVEAPTPWVPDGSEAADGADLRAAFDGLVLETIAGETTETTDSMPVACQPECAGAVCGEGDGCGGGCYEVSSCDDGADCTIDVCEAEAGGCVHIADHAACEDGNQCTAPLCEEGVGCTEVFVEGSCNDGDLCTTDDVCIEATCAGSPIDESACADENPCTEDVCQPSKGCVHLDGEGECEVAGGALPGLCQFSVCVPQAVLQAPCAAAGDCAVFDSGDPCAGSFVCGEEGFCQLDAESLPDCDDAQDTPCLKNRCVPENGGCEMQSEGDDLPCEDGDSCSLGDLCNSGNCVAGVGAVSCDDLNPCTADSCLPESGCAHVPAPGECSDGNLCTTDDSCADGICAGSPYYCSDGLDCTEDACLGDGTCLPPAVSAGWCVVAEECVEDGTHDPENWCRLCDSAIDAGAFSDVLFGTECPSVNAAGKCIQGECKNIECLPGFLSCDGTLTNGCEVDGAADPLHCGECDDPCLPGEVCVDGDCLGACPGSGLAPCGTSCPDHQNDPLHCGECGVVCEVLAPAEVGACQAGGCVPELCPQGLWDFDGNPGNGCEYECQLSGEEVCDGEDNDCDGFLDEESCDDGVDCTLDTCNAQLGCEHTPADLLCDDDNPCTTGSCDLLDGCSFLPVAGACDDGNPCTSGDQCQGASCVGEVVAKCCLEDGECDDGNSCTADLCDGDTHLCEHFSGPMDLEACDLDGDGCTFDQCLNGVCTAGALVACPAADETCQVAVCASLGPFDHACESQLLPEGAPCDDGLYCVVGEACDVAGVCGGGEARDCGFGLGSCFEVWCDEEADLCSGAPTDDGTPCDADGDGCTISDECQQGICFPGAGPDCPGDAAACQAGLCVSLGPDEYECEVGPAPPGAPCDDGLSCTVGEFCSLDGQCGSGGEKSCPPPGHSVRRFQM